MKKTPLEALQTIANVEMKEAYKVRKDGLTYRTIADDYGKELSIIEKELERNNELVDTLKQYDIFSIYELKDRLNRLNDIEKAIKKIFPSNEYTFGLLVNKIRNIDLQEKTDEALEIIEENLKYGYVFIGYDEDNKPLFQFADAKLYEEIKKNMNY